MNVSKISFEKYILGWAFHERIYINSSNLNLNIICESVTFRLLVGWLVDRSICHNFLKGRKLQFHAPCLHRGTHSEYPKVFGGNNIFMRKFINPEKQIIFM